jgi:hypothetical protein
MRRRDRPGNGAKKRLNASSARKRDRMPPPNPRKCRTLSARAETLPKKPVCLANKLELYN